MNMDKPGVRKRLRRRHHTQRVINNRAQLAYALGYTPMPVRWQPYRMCWNVDGHRLYKALGVECPCEWDLLNLRRTCRERNEPTNELSKHKTCDCERCKHPRWYYRGKQTVEALGRQRYRELLAYRYELLHWREEVAGASQ